MKIPEQGLGKEALFETLQSYRSRDLAWREGRAWGYVYHAGREVEEVGARAFTMFMTENALDPTVFPSLSRFEKEIIAMAAAHLQGDEHVAGSFTSGGTESILLAVKTARDKARAERPDLSQPEILVPVTAHAAFHKAAHYLGVRLVPTPVDGQSFRADVKAMRAAITPRTILLVGSASGYAHGVVDPIPEMGALAQEHGLLLHVDACIGGFVLPYFRKLGVAVPDFDFTVPGVTSISMDLHKYACTPKGASVVLYRNRELRRHQIFACSRSCGYTLINPTVQSTKSGGPLAAAWAVLHYLGQEGYLGIARQLLDAKQRLVEGIGAIPGLRVLGRPEMCLIGFASDTLNVFAIADEMKTRGWYVQPQLAYDASPENLHLTVAPNNVPWVDGLLADLRECAGKAPARGSSGLGDMVREAMGSGDLDEGAYAQLLGAAGVEMGVVPERMAETNEILNALPPVVKERLLIEFVNQM